MNQNDPIKKDIDGGATLERGEAGDYFLSAWPEMTTYIHRCALLHPWSSYALYLFISVRQMSVVVSTPNQRLPGKYDCLLSGKARLSDHTHVHAIVRMLTRACIALACVHSLPAYVCANFYIYWWKEC